MLKSTPFLLFDGNCAEAMKFYKSCLSGELTLTKLGDTPMKDQMPPEKHKRIVHAHLKSGAIEFSAADWLEIMHKPKQGTNFSIFIIGGTYGELKVVFDKLSEGADKEGFQELHNMPFGTYGQLTDRYGVPWIFKGDKRK
jgi:PhnB protein